jgi:hypothetical protein
MAKTIPRFRNAIPYEVPDVIKPACFLVLRGSARIHVTPESLDMIPSRTFRKAIPVVIAP